MKPKTKQTVKPKRKKRSQILAEVDVSKTSSDQLAISLQEEFGKESIVIDSMFMPYRIAGYYSTGSTLLDLSINGKGFPLSKIVLVWGEKGSGKTTLLLHCCKSIQDMGGTVIFDVPEVNFPEEFAYGVIGMRKKNTIMPNVKSCMTVEDTLNFIRSSAINAINLKTPAVLICIDGLDALPTRDELEKKKKEEETGEKLHAKMMGKPQLFSEFFRGDFLKIIGNTPVGVLIACQIRVKVPRPGERFLPFQETETFSVGNALKHYATVIIRLKRANPLTITTRNQGREIKHKVGIRIKSKVDHSKIGGEMNEAFHHIYFNRGIDDIDSIFDFLKEQKEIIYSGGYKFADKEDMKAVSEKEFINWIRDNPDIYQMIRERCKKYFQVIGS